MSQPVAIEQPRPARTSDTARSAARGTIYITIAKVWFMVSGYAIHFTLPRLITTEQFGIYQVVVSVVSIINAVIISGTYQTVSKHISQDPEKADSVKTKSLKLQVLIGGVASIGFCLLAPITARYLNDARLTNYLRLASLITLAYSFYAVFTGYFNRQRRFLTQAALDMTYSTLKLVLIVLLVWLGYGVAGAVGGFALAAAGVLAISWIVAGKGNRTGEVKGTDLLKFQTYLLVFTLVLNLLQKIDLILIKSLSASDPLVTSVNAAYYGAATNVANITYQIIVSVTFVIFPLVSRATFTNDREKTQGYISNTVRYTLMIMAGVATLLSANAAKVLSIVYPNDYQAGAAALSIVAYGLLLFGLVHVLTTIISASGRPAISLGIGLLTLILSATLNAVLIPMYGIAGAAAATTSSMLVGALICGAWVGTRFGALVSPLSVVRIAFAAGLVYAASLLLPTAVKPVILVELVALALLYAVALVVTGELGKRDLALMRRVLKV